MLQLTEVTLHRGDKALFDRLSLTVYASHKVGIVGRNGAGKTTLFDVIRRRLQPEEGTVEWPSAWRLSALDQYVAPSPRSALDFVLDGDRELRRVEREIAAAEKRGDDHALGTLYSDYDDVGGYDAHARGGEILGGLGFSRDDFDKAHKAFSGGWRIRLHLAQALMAPSDFLLLDEPTNHLDLEATLWLESWVRKYPGTLLTIAHDRDFLDKTIDEIVHLENGDAALYSGNYSGFERQRAEALTRQAALYKHQQQRTAEIQRFVDRFRAKASKARQVQSRIKALERIELVAPVHAESPYRFAFSQPKKISNPTLSLDAVSLGYDGNAVLDDVTLRVYPSDRIGVLGVNGAGKTTLLRCLAAELAPLDGRCARGRHSSVGYFAQHQLEALDLSRTPLEHIDEAVGAPAMTSQQTLDYLGGWGFHGDDVRRPAATFSGGEKARLVLAVIACQKPAVLVLDEPTNHLDLEMREALAVALQQYDGALLLVSHDRHLLRACVDDYWLVADGGVSRFKGDVDAYATLREARPRRAKQRRRKARKSRVQPLIERQRQLEAEIGTHTRQVSELERRLTSASTASRVDELAALAAEHKQAGAALLDLEAAWLAAQEEIDALGGEETARRRKATR